ncbi:hypothetical protein, partial [Halobacillus trueperi]|uniref:hypothetical protein n=1 Tax=Halobacillus trueperi TaxID=156205 RepID=UPI001ABF139E
PTVRSIKRSVSSFQDSNTSAREFDPYTPIAGLLLIREGGFETTNLAKGRRGMGYSCGKRVLGETPQKSEEAHRAPAESDPFPAAPIHSTKVSKLSLPQSCHLVEYEI